MHRRRRLIPLLAGALCASSLLAAGPVPAGATPLGPGKPSPSAPSKPERKGDLDVRSAGGAAQPGAQQRSRPGTAAAEERWRAVLGDQAVVQLDPLTGTPRMLARLDGFLTGRSGSSAEKVVLRYLRKHATELGLQPGDLDTLVLRKNYKDVAGIRHLSWVQVVGGVPVFGNGLKANVTKRGEIISLEGAPIEDLANQAAAAGPATVSADQSRRAAATDVGGRVADVRQTRKGARSVWANRDSASLVWFLTPGGLRRGWSTRVQAGGTLDYQHVIDASSGAVLLRHDLVDFANGDALVYDNYPGAPRGGEQHRRNLVKAGYLGKDAETLAGGTYVAAWSDINDDDLQNPGEAVPVPGRSGDGAQYRLTPFTTGSAFCATTVCTWDPTEKGSWKVNREADVTQGFYFTSRYHDYLKAKPFGFTRSAGNFEARGGDAVQLNALDGAATDGDMPDANHVDNANMSTPPDGTPPTMQMYLFHAPGATDDEDPFVPASSAFDADVILHEYTHGLSNRLVVDATGTSTLNSVQAGSMGEAWSDYYAQDYLVHSGFERDTSAAGEILTGRYVAAGQSLIRTMPIDCPVGTTSEACTRLDGSRGGYTYGELSAVIGEAEVHASGEIWGQTLWDLRRTLGHKVTGALVTRAMELSPADPSFLDMRNAIVQADLAVYKGKHTKTVWKVFAHRGMGFFAGTTDAADARPVEDFSRPPGKSTPRAAITGRVTDSVTGLGLADVRVAVGGHDSGFGGDYTARTDADGRYRIDHVAAGTYPVVLTSPAGYLPASRTATVTTDGAEVDYALRRDWAAANGGAQVVSAGGPDFTPYGCGPLAALDTSLGTGWVTTSGDEEVPTNKPTPKALVVALPAAVDVQAVAVDPAATCGVAGSASTGDYRIETSPDLKAWTTVSEGTFTAEDRGRLNEIAVKGSTGTRFVRFTALSPQVPDLATNCPDGAYDGCVYMSLAELVVYGSGSAAPDVAAVASGRR
ncbi:M36 family metallopeptidase [Microlunatus flavus]|uniref:F5/8 type C domain-containing protein n=1 Tax=Microlunatus flavus TaxID=1036181 RepID=A0A1H9CG06_9ACTN|nr:M36 family metallopeptidase [Microlunatus flavus]SEP99947.1 F5/8 type C domain-containing protein [Microlunatus flavus]